MVATTTLQLHPVEAGLPTLNPPALSDKHGANFTVKALSFDDTTDERCFWQLRALNFASVPMTVDIYWYTSSATGGSVVWEVAIAALTANDDSQDLETKTLAAADFIQQGHGGDTAKRVHRARVNVTNLNSLARDDMLFLQLKRDADGTNATDNLVGDAHVLLVVLQYAS